MNSAEDLAGAFHAARPRLLGIAYAVLGSHAEAEDVVSDVWPRLVHANSISPIRDVDAWTTVAVGRVALDAYRSARRRRERYVGPWLPEPLIDSGPDGDPADRVTLDERVSFAMLVVLESLTPAERTSWVLHDLFGLPFLDVAEAVGRRPDAVRQLSRRARHHLREHAPRVEVDAAQHARAVESFLTAAAGGDLAALVAVLDPDVIMTADGGGQVSAARRPVHGADRVARFFRGLNARHTDEEVRPLTVNGRTGLGLFLDNHLSGIVAFTVRAERITRIDFVRAPDKLGQTSNHPPSG
jgi:RNA polymerase sigma-70 factor, ECF subfamily